MLVWTGGGWGCTNTVAVATNALAANSAAYAASAGGLAGGATIAGSQVVGAVSSAKVATIASGTGFLFNLKALGYSIPGYFPETLSCYAYLSDGTTDYNTASAFNAVQFAGGGVSYQDMGGNYIGFPLAGGPVSGAGIGGYGYGTNCSTPGTIQAACAVAGACTFDP